MARQNSVMAWQVETLSTKNLHLLTQVAEDVFDHEILPDRARAAVDDPGQIFAIAHADNVTVAQARGHLHLQPDEAPVFYLDNLGVSPDWKRRGIATALVRTLAANARARGAKTLWLATEPDNEEANAFYRHLGLTSDTVVYFETQLDGFAP